MIFEPLFANAHRQPEHLAVVDDRGSYTYQQLSQAAAGLGMLLGTQTSQPRVGLLLPTGAGFVASFYGTLLAGKTVVPINFLLGIKEIAHIVKDSGIDTVITVPHPLLSPKIEGLPLNVIDLTQLPQSPPFKIDPVFPKVSANDLAVVMYTSGTSGMPKGVLLTYDNLESDVEAAIEHAHLVDKYSFLGVLPLFHTTGLLATMVAPIRLGSTVYYQARFSPLAVINAIKEHQISIIAAVPSMYGAMMRLKNVGPEDVKSLYAALSGGEPLPGAIREGFEQKFGIPIYEGYGLTETIGPIAFNVPGAIRPGSVGKLIPGAQVRIADDDGNPMPGGQAGEVWLKGPMIMQGYNNLPDETRAALTPDGYFKSGDLGLMDADGYLHITGRKKDLIIVAGEKASPREIEEILNQHPAVAEAAVLGKKDASRGEVVAAFIIPREGQSVKPDDLRDFCRQHGMVQWKIPRDIQVVTDLPRSPTGKVLKRVLAERFTN
ncbi:MAG TPA: AMP-binding protein [Tepidisphaeraceae bacterium]|nr:AMP-binding protein [Tepidisphaeraceae bacterium]